MLVSKKNKHVDMSLFSQHLLEMPDGDYFVQLVHLNDPSKKQLGYFMGHITPTYQRFLSDCGIFVNKNSAAQILKEAMGFGEPKVDFEVDLGLTRAEFQEMIDRSFHKLIELGMNPIHPKDR